MSWKNKKYYTDADIEAYGEEHGDEDDLELLNFDLNSGSDSDKDESCQEDTDNDEIESDEVGSNIINDNECQPRSKRMKINNSEGIKWQEASHVDPKKHPFNKENSGCKNIHDNVTILNCFELFFDEDIVTKIVEQTNIFHSQTAMEKSNHARKWIDVTNGEFRCFIALSLLMPQVKKLKIKNYWSKNLLLETPIFGQVMTRDRYNSILRNVHFVNNNESNKDVKKDKLWKIRTVMTHIQNSFKRVFYPFENLCIDESFMLFKGRLSFKQYIPSKRHRFGVKFFILCDCETRYILNFIIYVGRGSDIEEKAPDVGISGNIVLTLMEDYLNAGHTLFTDNWYTSPNLYNFLCTQKTNACGTVKQNRKNMPKFGGKLKRRGDIECFSSQNLLALKWQDKREVNLLSTFHKAEMSITDKVDFTTKEFIPKPKVVIDYNSNMGAVDQTDMLQISIESVRKSTKWYKKVFFHFIDMILLNAHAVYGMKTGKNVPIADFQLSLVQELLEKYHSETARTSARQNTTSDSPLRCTGRHFFSHLPKTDSNKQIRKRCVVCSKKKIRRETTYQCSLCDVALCVIPCMEWYHTKKIYWV